MAGCIGRARNGHTSTSALKSDVTCIVFHDRFLLRRGNFGYSAINKGYITYFLRLRETAVFPFQV